MGVIRNAVLFRASFLSRFFVDERFRRAVLPRRPGTLCRLERFRLVSKRSPKLARRFSGAASFAFSLFIVDRVMNFNFKKNDDARRPDGETDVLLENVRLREEMEEFADADAFYFNRYQLVSVEKENQILREELDWERSPVLPILEQLGPNWNPLDVSTATDAEVAAALLDLLERLRRANQEIWGADHLSNRRLYGLIERRLLPCKTKRMARPCSPTVWSFAFYAEEDSLDAEDDAVYLTYYATPEERLHWARERNVAPPQHQTPPFARRFPTFVFRDACCDRD